MRQRNPPLSIAADCGTKSCRGVADLKVRLYVALSRAGLSSWWLREGHPRAARRRDERLRREGAPRTAWGNPPTGPGPLDSNHIGLAKAGPHIAKNPRTPLQINRL